MNKIYTKTAALTLALVLTIAGCFSLTIDAEELSYRYTDDTPTVSTPEAFEQFFSSKEIDKILYDYSILPFESRGSVFLSFKIKIGDNEFIATAEGIVNAYTLPSGNIIIEGPLDGNIMVDNDYYNIIVGFAWLESTEQAAISVALQYSSDLFIAFSFGENVIEGEELDFFLNRNNNSVFSNGSDGIGITVTPISPLNIQSSNVYTTTRFDDITIGIFDPGGGGGGNPGLGPNGQYAYQNKTITKWESTSYNALQTGVYFDQSRNLLMVTLRPFSSTTNAYVQEKYVTNGGYDYAGASLYSFGVELVLTEAPASNYAYIAAFDIPESNSGNAVALHPVFEDLLSIIGVPTSTITSVLGNMDGKIETTFPNSRLNASIDVTLGIANLANTNDLENIYTGLPIQFQLAKANATEYQGDTPYTVNTYVKYCVYIQDMSPITGLSCYYQYHTETYSYEGEIDLG